MVASALTSCTTDATVGLDYRGRCSGGAEILRSVGHLPFAPRPGRTRDRDLAFAGGLPARREHLGRLKMPTGQDKLGEVMFGNQMIDEASRKMAEQLSIKGRSARHDQRLAQKQAAVDGGVAVPTGGAGEAR